MKETGKKFSYKAIGIALVGIFLLVCGVRTYQEVTSDLYKITKELKNTGGADSRAYYDKKQNSIVYFSDWWFKPDESYSTISLAEERIAGKNIYCHLNFGMYTKVPPMNDIDVTNYIPDDDNCYHIPESAEAYDTMLYMETSYVPYADEIGTEIPSIKYLVCYVDSPSGNGDITDGAELEFLKLFPNLEHLTLIPFGDFEASDKNIEEIRQFIPENCTVEF